MADNVLIPSALRAGFSPVVMKIDEIGATCDTPGAEWLRHNVLATRMVLDAIFAESEPFVVADADVRFYGAAAEDMARCLGGGDIAFQCDCWNRCVPCLGFFIVRPCLATRSLFTDIIHGISEIKSKI
jgi:hypothetical protein